MEKKETKNKNQIQEKNEIVEESAEKTKTEGFPKDVDFKKFLGCGA